MPGQVGPVLLWNTHAGTDLSTLFTNIGTKLAGTVV